MHNTKMTYRGHYTGIYWGQNLQIIQTFWFVRLREGEVWKNIAWKLQKYGWWGGRNWWSQEAVCKYFGKRLAKIYLLCLLISL